MLPIPNRAAAGKTLAGKLGTYAGKKSTLLLGLLRGGASVAAAAAPILNIPCYPYAVRKIGHPEHREYGIGAIAEGGGTYLDEDRMREHEIRWEEIEPIIGEEMAELRRRKEAFDVRGRPSMKGKNVIFMDDGAATGVTLFAAIQDARTAGAKKVIVAIPVCPPDTAKALASLTDQAIILATPSPFDAVGKWYTQFTEMTDADVWKALKK
jgi:putative phosphoribosyl transferase